jgi:hypothetical protein
MSYRDDREADRARIAALEAELTAANRRIDELEGNRSQALVLASDGALTPAGKPSTRAAKWAGAPVRLALDKKLEGTFPADKFEDVVAAIRRITGDHGRIELLRSSMTWWATSPERGVGPFISINLTTKDGVTTLSMTERLAPLAGAIYGGIGGGVGGGGLAAPVFASIAVPILAPLFVLGWVGGTYGICRAIYKRSAKKRAEKLQMTFEAVVAEVERELRSVATSKANLELSPVERTRQVLGEDTRDAATVEVVGET